jgi:orotate phosphoribosyltransferase
VRDALQTLLIERSVSRGDFVLASGRRSDYYVDCRRTTFHPKGAWLIGRLLEGEIHSLVRPHQPIHSIGGLTLGADPVAVAISIASHEMARPGESPLRAFTVRKEAKTHGRGNRIEGSFEPHDRVMVIEDVVTTGSSALSAVTALREAGASIAGVMALVDRDEGGREAIEAAGLSLRALFRIGELL